MNKVIVPGVNEIIGSGLLAQGERLSLIASNIANADSVATSGAGAYRAMEPVFEAVPANPGSPVDGVQVAGVVQSSASPRTKYDPASPFADAAGYVTTSNVDPVQQMVDLISASQNYSDQIAVMDQTTRMGQAMTQSFIT